MSEDSSINAYTDEPFRCPLLMEKNHPTCERSIKMRLIADNCWEIVISDEEAPNSPILADDFRKRAGKAASIINSTLSSGVEFYVKDTINPREMWNIRQNKLTLRILTDINRLRVFQQQLQGTVKEISNNELVKGIMTWLPTCWEQRIITRDDRRNLTLHDLDRALRSHQPKIADILTQATKPCPVTRQAGYQGGKERGYHGRGRIFGPIDHKGFEHCIRSCWYYHKPGHSQNACGVKKKVVEARKGRIRPPTCKEPDSGRTSASISLADTHGLMLKRESVKYAPGDWFIDSGTTDHMGNEHTDFFSVTRLSSLIKVLLGVKLLSVSAITRLRYQVIFNDLGYQV
ncbi:hypothetical protein HOY80DRAFT_1045087 [Tuber brumale]|nr:hypothetical protein HOY80DRAFT_1045087 [Tuber brumale]